MESPPSPVVGDTMDVSTPATARRYEDYEVKALTRTASASASVDGEVYEDSSSSPFLSSLNEANDSGAREHDSPTKCRPVSRILSGTELSPLKILSERPDVINKRSEGRDVVTAAPKIVHSKSLRKHSRPENRFPVKATTSSNLADATPRSAAATNSRIVSLEQAVKENPDLNRAIDIFEDDQSIVHESIEEEPEDLMHHDSPSPSLTPRPAQSQFSSQLMPHEAPVTMDGDNNSQPVEDDDSVGIDDTMVSTFSTFSAVPSMTMLARTGQTPSKFSTFGGGLAPPGLGASRGSVADPSPSRTPRAAQSSKSATHESDTTNLLVGFSEQLSHSRMQAADSDVFNSASPSKGMANHAANATTPRRRASNLIDFDLPPMPTPRSIPTITPRELESLKSGFLSEISGLRASLSGKEAEAASLKTAVGDAEMRVGECMEQLRDLRGERETLTSEKDGWERRGREMEKVLREVKEEIVRSQREREELDSKFHESEQRREAAEMMAQDAESKMAGMRAGKASADAHMGGSGSPERHAASPSLHDRPDKDRTAQEVELAVERVARELHALYKSKHETKVSALKKSYEGRWEKRVRELEDKIQAGERENEELRMGRDGTMTQIDLDRLDRYEREIEERKRQAVQDQAEMKQLDAQVRRMEAVAKETKRDNEEIRGLLERERVEKGELVILAEELMSIQQQGQGQAQQQQQQQRQGQQSNLHRGHHNGDGYGEHYDGGREDRGDEEVYEDHEEEGRRPIKTRKIGPTPTMMGGSQRTPVPNRHSMIQHPSPARIQQSSTTSQRPKSLIMATPAASRAAAAAAKINAASSSVGRTSGLRAPGSVTNGPVASRIGGIGRGGAVAGGGLGFSKYQGGRGQTQGQGQGQGQGGLRSGIMNSIEKMGR